VEIYASGEAPRLRDARRFFAATGGLRSAFGRLFGTFFVGISDARVAIALGAARGSLRGDALIVLERHEIALVDSSTELWAIPGPDGGLQRAEFRFIDLHLSQSRSAALLRAVERGPKLPSGIYPVSLPQPGVLRLVWDGPGIHVSPDLDVALELLGARSQRAVHPDPEARAWQELSDHELGERILRLYDAGRFDEAVSILRARDRVGASPPAPRSS
jgi:hypothetical protein